jgi:ketosteroid isomerase-like protein
MDTSGKFSRRSVAIVWTVVLPVVWSACTARPAAAPSPDVLGLRAVSDAYARSFSTKDASAVVQFFAPDIVVMSPQARAPVRGLDANRAGWERLFRGGNPVHTITTDTIVVSERGDLGYSLGHWAVGVDTPNGRAESSGDYLAVWRRTGGQWRIVALSAYTVR